MTATLPFLPTLPNRCRIRRALPCSERLAVELLAAIGDQRLRLALQLLDHAVQECLNLERGWATPEDVDSVTTTGTTVDDGGYPPAERPRLFDRVGEPRKPEAGAAGRHSGEVYVPDVVGLPRSRASRGLSGLKFFGFSHRPFFEHAADCRGADLDTCSTQDLRDLGLAEAWAEELQSLRCIAEHAWEPVDRRACLDEVTVVHTLLPRCDGERRDQKVLGRLLVAPPANGHEFEEAHAFGGE